MWCYCFFRVLFVLVLKIGVLWIDGFLIFFIGILYWGLYLLNRLNLFLLNIFFLGLVFVGGVLIRVEFMLSFGVEGEDCDVEFGVICLGLDLVFVSVIFFGIIFLGLVGFFVLGGFKRLRELIVLVVFFLMYDIGVFLGVFLFKGGRVVSRFGICFLNLLLRLRGFGGVCMGLFGNLVMLI